jgi:hypothetical protein
MRGLGPRIHVFVYGIEGVDGRVKPGHDVVKNWHRGIKRRREQAFATFAATPPIPAWIWLMGGIIWLASYPKSGNTWMRAFLHNLLRDAPAPVPINELTQFTIGDTLVEWYAEIAGRPLEGMSDAELAKLRPIVHRRFTQQHADSVFVKTHMALGEAAGMPTITMDCTAGAIYLIRDPRDVAISAAAHFGTDIDGAIAIMNDPTAHTRFDGINVPQYYGTWSQHVRSWTTEPNKMLRVVRYEDLLDKPGPTFGGLARFLGLKPSPARLVKAIKFASFDELRKQEQKSGFIERSLSGGEFFREGRAGQWRERLTPEQIARITDAHREVMADYGYL